MVFSNIVFYLDFLNFQSRKKRKQANKKEREITSILRLDVENDAAVTK